jgi:hypothetical protein
VVKPGPFARFAFDEARRGHPYPLIGRLTNALQGSDLSDDEIRFIVDAVEATQSKYGADKLRDIERELIVAHVEDLGSTKKAAEEVARQRGRSRRHVFNALKARKAKDV